MSIIGMNVVVVLRFTLPCLVAAVVLSCWFYYVALWPMFIADSLYGSEQMLADGLLCTEWIQEDDHQVRRCALDTRFHRFDFVQVAIKDANGSVCSFPRELRSETKTAKTVVATVALAGVLALGWLAWRAAIRFVMAKLQA